MPPRLDWRAIMSTGTPQSFEPVRDGTLPELLRTLAERRGGREALVYPAFAHGDDAVRLSFAELDSRVDQLARGLMGLGVEAGEHVALWAPNLPDWVPLEFALARIGAVLVTVNTALAADEVAYVLRQSKARTIIHGARHGQHEASAALDTLFERDDPGVAGVANRVWMPARPGEMPPVGIRPIDSEKLRGPILSLGEVVDMGRHIGDDEFAARQAAVAPDDVVNIQYTSGTTGFPKGVMLTHRNLLSNGCALADSLEMTADDRVALIVPLFHCFGCVVCVLGAYTHGAALCCIPAFEPGAALRLLAEERISIVNGVPTMFNAMLHDPARELYTFPALRTGIVAGAPCPVPLMQEIDTLLGCHGIGVAYGLTEASPGVTGPDPHAPLEKRATTCGRLIRDVEVRFVDPATGAVLDGAGGLTGDGAGTGAEGEACDGEVQVRGPGIMAGYHDDPEGTAAALTEDGWLRTGDLGRLGPDGFLRITGRSKDIIIRGGENIAPAEIESLLRSHTDVVDAAVVGVPDEHFGEEVAAGVILKAGRPFDPQDLADSLAGHIAKFKVPRRWKVFGEFPLTGSGKVKKFELRRDFDDGVVSTGA